MTKLWRGFILQKIIKILKTCFLKKDFFQIPFSCPLLCLVRTQLFINHKWRCLLSEGILIHANLTSKSQKILISKFAKIVKKWISLTSRKIWKLLIPWLWSSLYSPIMYYFDFWSICNCWLYATDIRTLSVIETQFWETSLTSSKPTLLPVTHQYINNVKIQNL